MNKNEKPKQRDSDEPDIIGEWRLCLFIMAAVTCAVLVVAAVVGLLYLAEQFIKSLC